MKVIGKDGTYSKNAPIKTKCSNCGTIFEATIDDFDLTTIGSEYRLKTKCPDCGNFIFYHVGGVVEYGG